MFVAKAPSVDELIDELGPREAVAAIDAPVDERVADRYLHWDKLRHLDPPGELTSEQWWLQLKFARKGDLRRLPLTDPDGTVLLDNKAAFVHGLQVARELMRQSYLAELLSARFVAPIGAKSRCSQTPAAA